MTVRLHILAVLLAFAVLLAPPAHASDYSTDTSFALSTATPGWRRSFAGTGSVDEHLVAAARTLDGGYLIAGSRAGGSAGVSIFLAKFRPDGSYDPAFGNSAATGNAGAGRVLKDAYLSSVTDMTIDAQGRIVVVGRTPGALGQSDFGVVRFKADGTDDTSFAGDGGTGIPFDADAAHSRVNDVPDSVTTAPDGSIFVAGTITESIGGVATTVVGVAKLQPNGSLATTFTDDSGLPSGLREFCRAGCPGVLHVARILYDADSARLHIGGDYSVTSTDTDWFLVSLNVVTQNMTFSTHAIDFGGDSGYQLGYMTSIALQSDGKLLASGWANDSTLESRPVVLRRMASNPAEDTTFGNVAGRGLSLGDTKGFVYNDLAIDSRNRIILAGTSGTPSKGAVFRLLPNGHTDFSFSSGVVPVYLAPISSLSSPAYTTEFKRMFLDRGQPVIAGEAPYSSSANTDYDLVITRLNADLIFANNFD